MSLARQARRSRIMSSPNAWRGGLRRLMKVLWLGITAGAFYPYPWVPMGVSNGLHSTPWRRTLLSRLSQRVCM